MHSRAPFTIKVNAFEGPLDLLLFLIQSHELDISKVSISKITDQYLAYVRYIQQLNFDLASEFLVMAATLIHWKSKALLPNEDAEASPEEDEGPMSQEDLIRQLLEHKRFLAAGESLAQLPLLDEDVYLRPVFKTPIERVWRDMNVSHLALSYQDTVVNARKRKQILKKETVSLTDKIAQFGTTLHRGEVTELAKLMGLDPDRPEIVVTLLASLELARLKKLKLYQNENYTPIFVELTDDIQAGEIQLAHSFEYLEAATP